MQQKYPPAALEAAVQRDWAAREVYKAVETASRKKFYGVSMLPYPSGKLHMGHVRNYTINDVMIRQMRMKGFNTLMPMGWDAFGLPAENAAIAHGIAPAQWTYRNIAAMKKQLQALGLAIDWSREITTCAPGYYQWNQWLFLKMLEAGLVYRQTGPVNWDPVDQTVLSNEQVIDGRGWRSGALVEKREIPMYYLRITRYADALLADLDHLGWPESVKRMQQNWLGKSEGVTVAFPYHLDGQPQSLRVFTTRADTIMGIAYCAIAPEHPLAARLARARPALQRFLEECKCGGLAEADLATTEKKGIATGFFVQHPLTGQNIEVWIANYVLMRVGEGAVMGVPAHDARDFAFAQKYGLPIKPVIEVNGQAYSAARWNDGYAESGLCIQSGKYDGLSSAEAIKAVGADLKARGLGEPCTRWRLRDWGISRQRYWGTPIPMIHCDACGVVPVPRSDLPVRLPEDLVPDGSGNPLAKSAAFIDCVCPQCGARARRETDTMDTFVDSSWYFLRYACPGAAEMVDARVNDWMPMDQYIGGVEHAILHLLYARFWTKVMHGLGLVAFDEPAQNLFTQGMVLNQTYYREPSSGQRQWFNPAEVTPIFDDKGRLRGATLNADGQPVEAGGIEKMSKSKNNGVDPQTLIDQYGADTVRLFTIFAAPPDAPLEWSGAGVEGAHRFLRRLWTLGQQFAQAGVLAGSGQQTQPQSALRREIHQLLKQAEFDYQRLQYNTVVSAAMKMLNALDAALPDSADEANHAVMREGWSILLRVLYPVVPHISTALWQRLGFSAESGGALLDAPWPEIDSSALAAAEIDLVLQINGKTRGMLRVAQDAARSAIEQAALEHELFARFDQGKPPRKIVVVPGRLVNIVV
ncbi:Leucyl-tRNA synthetase (Leucine--tRNA ligase) (LeuRS) [Candidatus Glomeribacter gigasporarum BEG34]|uniref:Leucine--tRNA ligase n=1 Tax=Candidatus Glomeribacter gigasporarum BEG34 TaxID=1070319 RepID=G2J816_9BURK|nr:leucine--tRNA ligase [Candidatus Glomeribacter gigasporarum]CCD28913.1 Leucyl-tRNA synthetase (Leucine--tRNA ligase) (LeuRS) [Candidatus Glomeribacter gigasporarum BEG34]